MCGWECKWSSEFKYWPINWWQPFGQPQADWRIWFFKLFCVLRTRHSARLWVAVSKWKQRFRENILPLWIGRWTIGRSSPGHRRWTIGYIAPDDTVLLVNDPEQRRLSLHHGSDRCKTAANDRNCRLPVNRISGRIIMTREVGQFGLAELQRGTLNSNCGPEW